MKNAGIVSAVRTPVGTRGGVYKTLQRLDLTTPVVKEALKRANITSDMVEENIWGNIPMYLTPSRYVWLSADGDIDTVSSPPELNVNFFGGAGPWNGINTPFAPVGGPWGLSRVSGVCLCICARLVGLFIGL